MAEQKELPAFEYGELKTPPMIHMQRRDLENSETLTIKRTLLKVCLDIWSVYWLSKLLNKNNCVNYNLAIGWE